MISWVKTQWRALVAFGRGPFRSQLFHSAVAFAVLMCGSFLVFLFSTTAADTFSAFLETWLSGLQVQTEDGSLSAFALFANNLRACLLSVFYGVIPLLHLSALVLGVNAILLGAMGALCIRSGYSIGFYLLGILPHGVFELPALLLSLSLGLYLCAQLTCRCLHRPTDAPLRDTLANIGRALLLWALPLLVLAAAVESTVTPHILSLFM